MPKHQQGQSTEEGPGPSKKAKPEDATNDADNKKLIKSLNWCCKTIEENLDSIKTNANLARALLIKLYSALYLLSKDEEYRNKCQEFISHNPESVRKTFDAQFRFCKLPEQKTENLSIAMREVYIDEKLGVHLKRIFSTSYGQFTSILHDCKEAIKKLEVCDEKHQFIEQKFLKKMKIS